MKEMPEGKIRGLKIFSGVYEEKIFDVISYLLMVEKQLKTHFPFFFGFLHEQIMNSLFGVK